MPRHDFAAYYTAVAADNAWSAELQRLFGNRAGDVRYTRQGQGEPGSKLNALYRLHRAAADVWLEQMAAA